MTRISLSGVHEYRETRCVIEGVTSQLMPTCPLLEHHCQLISIDNKGWSQLSPRCCCFSINSKRKRPFGSFCTQAERLTFYSKLLFQQDNKQTCMCSWHGSHPRTPDPSVSHTQEYVSRALTHIRPTEKDVPYPSQSFTYQLSLAGSEEPSRNLTSSLRQNKT